MVALEFAA